MHSLSLTNGSRLVAHNLINIPDTFKTPSDMMLAGTVLGVLKCPAVTEKQSTDDAWLATDAGKAELSEKQRDLLKSVMDKHVTKLTPNVHVLSLLRQLGYE